MKKICIVFISVLMIFAACKTTQGAVQESPGEMPSAEESAGPEPAVQTAPVSPKPPEENFDPATITKEEYDTAKTDVQALIENLNNIIRARDYGTWLTYLSAEYFDAISNPDYLANLSESARLKNQKIVLKSPEDYFLHVVVPSRANDRVDDIEFISKTQVKAYTINARGQKLRLYNLEKEGETWKIIN